MNCMRLTSRWITSSLVSLHQCRRLPRVDECFWSLNHHFAVLQDIDWLDVQLDEWHAPRWWTLLIDFKLYLQLSQSSSPNSRTISPIRIIINCTDVFVYFDTLKERISCYYFAVVFFHLFNVILVQRIFHLGRCAETVSNDRLYTYNILPYQPGAYQAVYLHCYSRLVTPQTGRI